ncbi:hypothetical protein AVEN_12518-1 [Araneus ventricosus]|uniref:Uncharacterized protein n=1 Tax=Araneus ventricosus TaxID=182803 RepID=A0A4Y2IMN4_ARAVE|nr:hypothetical protein AVEN_12518-1 [Araneus ventricosus]
MTSRSSVDFRLLWITSAWVRLHFTTGNMNKLVIIAFAVVAMAVLVVSEEIQGEGFHGHFDQHGYKVSIEHQPHGHEHHHHGGHGHSERYFHIQHHGHHHHGHQGYE